MPINISLLGNKCFRMYFSLEVIEKRELSAITSQ